MSGVLNALENWERPSARDRALSGTPNSAEAPKSGKKRKQSDILLEKIHDAGYDMEELEPFLRTRGDLLAIACAGAGKTTGLTFKILYDAITGELSEPMEVNGQTVRVPHKVWVSTFLRTGAEELGRTLRKWQHTFRLYNIAQSVKFSTLHAEFKSALESLGVEVSIIDSAENKKLLIGILKSYGYVFNSEELNTFMGALTYTRNRLDASRYNADIYNEKRITTTVLDTILADWSQARRTAKKMDFEDLQDLLYDWLYVTKDPRVIEAIANRYKYIYVDEFQDTSQKQYAILRAYSAGANKTIVIGDDDQTIYTWRGSSNEIITQMFERDYRPTVVKLSKNYRCPSNILNPIIPSIEQNTDRYSKPITAAREGGELRVGYFEGYPSMVNALSKGIAADVAAGREVAVLCRTNVDGLVPAMMLEKAGGINFSVSGTEMTFDSYIGKQILSITSLVKGRGGEQVLRALRQVAYDRNQPKLVADECRASKVKLWDLDPSELAASAPKIAVHVLRWMDAWHNQGLRELDMLIYLLNYYKEHVYKKDTQYNQTAHTVLDALSVLAASGNYDNIADFNEEIGEINERLKSRQTLNSGIHVRIATVHEFKGKESDSVYVWNDTAGVFPHRKSDDIEEERRLHYIACTRARDVSTIITLDSKPSPFLSEMDLTGAQIVRPGLRKRIGAEQ